MTEFFFLIEYFETTEVCSLRGKSSLWKLLLLNTQMASLTHTGKSRISKEAMVQII